jgi:LPXTG-site transpeptidase (sortase) family protein
MFAVLNGRLLLAHLRFWLEPGTFVATQAESPRLLPLAKDVTSRPLPDSARLVIDRINVDAPIVFGVPDDRSLIYKNLENGVVHSSNTSKPGMSGSAIILGHSSAYPWYKGKYGSVFALLSKLKVGERFYVQYEDGRIFTFEIKQSLIFNPLTVTRNTRVMELEKNPRPNIILISCWPVGTDYMRIAVQAELVTQ